MTATGARDSGAGSFFIACQDGGLDPRSVGAVVVAIDVIRATTTAITAAALGWRCWPVGSIEEVWALARRLDAPLLAGELGGRRPEGFDLQNSPSEVSAREERSRPLILLSTSGMPLVAAAARRGPTYLACLRNARASARQLAGEHRRIAILAADPAGRLRREDGLCAARVGAGLQAAGYTPEDEATAAILKRWSGATEDAIIGGRSAAYLESSGQHGDLEFVRAHVDDLDSAFVIDQGVVVGRAA